MTPSSVKVQISPESVPSTPSWFGEVTLIAHVFTQRGLISALVERVQFARARFGTYDTIDFVVVLLGYAVSRERTLEEFYDRLQPFGLVFMSLFERADLPSRFALSRYLAAFDKSAVEALRTLFQEDLGASRELGQGGVHDREGKRWVVIDVDATRAAARQRALPHGPDLPPAHRRMDAVCAPGYFGRKRGEVVRSRTTVLQAHTQSWLGTFGGAGNGDYRGELLQAIKAICSLAQAWSIPLSRILIRLDGLYGDAAPLIDLLASGLGMVVRGRDYALLDLPSVQARLVLPPDAWTTHPESGVQRALFDCPGIPLTPTGIPVRMIVAVHQASAKEAPIGITKNGWVYEIFLTSAPKEAFTASDVLHLYLHRGSFETVLAHEDQEQDPDRWVSHNPWGQECWQILSQWIWNTRLELGQHLEPSSLRLTELVPEGVVTSPDRSALIEAMASHAEDVSALTKAPEKSLPPVGYGPPVFSANAAHAGFPGTAFSLQPDGTVRCPADKPLYPQERKLQADGSLRIVYAARISHCRVCPLREKCQGSDKTPRNARRVSAVSQPLSVEEPALASVPSPRVSTPTASVSVEAENAHAQAGSAPPVSPDSDELVSPPPMSTRKKSILPAGYGPPTFSANSAHAGFAGAAFSLQPDGTVLCPAEHPLSLQEQKPLANGALRLVYAARITHCRSCPLRLACQGSDNPTLKARRVHAVCQPLPATKETTTVPIEHAPPSTESVPPVLEPAPSPVQPASLEIEHLPPQNDQSVPIPLEPTPSPIQPASLEIEHLSPQNDQSVPPVLEPLPSPVQPASLETEHLPPQDDQSIPIPLERFSPPTTTAVLWEDWPALSIRQQWLKRLRTETVHLTIGPPETPEPTPDPEPLVLTRAQRAHWRMSWRERFTRNARRSRAPALSITLHGLPASFAQAFALDIAA